jgi:hypothetical protein
LGLASCHLVSGGVSACYVVQQQMSNTNRGIIDGMAGRRAPVVPIVGDGPFRLVPARVGPSRLSDSNHALAVDIAHFRAAGTTPSNTSRS